MREPKYFNRLAQIRDVINIKRYNLELPPITQAKLAECCGVSRQTIIAIEQHEQMPSYPLAITICAILRKLMVKLDPKASVSLLDLFPVPHLNKDPNKSAKTGTPATLDPAMAKMVEEFGLKDSAR